MIGMLHFLTKSLKINKNEVFDTFAIDGLATALEKKYKIECT